MLITNLYSTSFNKFGPQVAPRSFTLRQKYGNHTLAWLDYDFYRDREYVLPPEGTPISVRWGQNPGYITDHFGYVNHYETITSPVTNKTGTRLVSMGTSKRLNTTSTDSWYNTTHSNVFRDIVSRYKFRSIIHPNPYIFDYWASGTETDFQTIRRLADETGYRVWIDGATAYFLDPKRLLKGIGNQLPPHFYGIQIHNSDLSGGHAAVKEKGPITRKVVHGLDYHSNELFTSTEGLQSTPDEIVGVTANTFREAQFITNAELQNSDHYYTVHTEVNGDTRLYPGVVMELGTGGVSNDLRGTWVVQEVTHEIARGYFNSKVVAIRNSLRSPRALLSPLKGTRLRVPAVVRDGSFWEAPIQEHVNA